MNYLIDLLRCQRLFKGRHDVREAAVPAAVGYHRFPRGVVFRRGLIALGKVGKGAWALEFCDRLRCPSAIRAMASDASRLINVLAGVQLQR